MDKYKIRSHRTRGDCHKVGGQEEWTLSWIIAGLRLQNGLHWTWTYTTWQTGAALPLLALSLENISAPVAFPTSAGHWFDVKDSARVCSRTNPFLPLTLFA